MIVTSHHKFDRSTKTQCSWPPQSYSISVTVSRSTQLLIHPKIKVRLVLTRHLIWS